MKKGNNMRRIIYDGNSVYEPDDEALLKKRLDYMKEHQNKEQNQKIKSLSNRKQEKKRT